MRTLAITCMLVLCSLIAYSQWISLGPDGGTINCLEKVDNSIWAATNGGIFESDDEGLTWHRLPLITTRCIDIMSFHDTTIVLYIDTGTSYWGDLQSDFYTTSTFDNGNTWSNPARVIPAANSGLIYTYYMKLGRHESALYLTHEANPLEYYVSLNYGLSWLVVQDSLPWRMIPYDSDTIVLSNGNLLTDNHGIDILRIEPDTSYVTNSGLAAQITYTLHANKDVLFASTYTDIYRSNDKGESWEKSSLQLFPILDMEFIGDTIFCAVQGPSLVGRSFDDGNTWHIITVPIWGNIATPDFSVLEYRNGRLFYGPGDKIRYSDDFGDTWHPLPALTTNPDPFPDCTNLHDTTGYIKLHKNDLFTVTNDGAIHKFIDSLHAWQQVHCIRSTGAHNGNKLYDLNSAIVMTGREDIVYSLDEGDHWQTCNLNGLPLLDPRFNTYQVPQNLILFEDMWIGTCGRFGIYASKDFGDNWFQLDSIQTPFSAFGGLVVIDSMLYSGSGCSVWRREGVPTFVKEYEPGSSRFLKAFPNPASDYLTVELGKMGDSRSTSLFIYNNLGVLIKNQQITSMRPTINLYDFSSGVYFGKIFNAETGAAGIFKFIVSK